MAPTPAWHIFFNFSFTKLFMMKKITMSFCLAAFLAAGIGCGGNQTSETTNTDSVTTTSQGNDTSGMSAGASNMSTSDTSKAADRDFAMEAASSGLMEVTLGRLAESNAASAQVKELGKMMVTDHSQANSDLKAVAAQKNLTLPTSPMEQQQKQIDELKTKKGEEFDNAYIDMMVDDHKKDIEKFQDEANKGNDADIKAFAAKTLPVLQKHLDHIQKIKDGMKK